MYSIRQITTAVKGILLKFHSDSIVTRLAFDSRKVIEPAHSLFFAIRGKRHDGHQHMKELYQKGVRNFIITNPEYAKDDLPEANIIRVDNAISALQHMASFHRKNFKYPVIGITGSRRGQFNITAMRPMASCRTIGATARSWNGNCTMNSR